MRPKNATAPRGKNSLSGPSFILVVHQASVSKPARVRQREDQRAVSSSCLAFFRCPQRPLVATHAKFPRDAREAHFLRKSNGQSEFSRRARRPQPNVGSKQTSSRWEVLRRRRLGTSRLPRISIW